MYSGQRKSRSNADLQRHLILFAGVVVVLKLSQVGFRMWDKRRP
jgi:hypothetical protein